MRVLQVYEIIYMNIVRCGLLGLPGELQHTRASFPHLALQGANKFFTLAMRPVQPLTWDCAGHGHGWLTRCTQKLVKPSQTFCILQQKSVQKEHSSSLRRIIYNHCKHWKVRQTPAVRMRCIPMPVILRNHERTCEQRTGRKGYNYCATPRQTCWLNVAIRWIKDSGPETHQIQVSVKKGVHAKIPKDATPMSTWCATWCNSILQMTNTKGRACPLFLRIQMHGVEEKRCLHTWVGFFPIRMRYLAKPWHLHDSWKLQELTFLASWFASPIVWLTNSTWFNQNAEKPRRSSVLQFVVNCCSQQFFSFNLCNLPLSGFPMAWKSWKNWSSQIQSINMPEHIKFDQWYLVKRHLFLFFSHCRPAHCHGDHGRGAAEPG